MAEGCVHASEGIRSGAAVAGGRRLEFPASAEKGESGQAGEVLRDQERAELDLSTPKKYTTGSSAPLWPLRRVDSFGAAPPDMLCFNSSVD